MQKIKFKGTIYYDVDHNHPDIDGIKNPNERQTYSDTFIFDPLYWGDDYAGMQAYVKRELALVAGGGYSIDHIHNVTYKIYYETSLNHRKEFNIL